MGIIRLIKEIAFKCRIKQNFNFHFHLFSFVRYQGDCSNATVVDAAIQEGLNSIKFRSLIAWITNELTVLLDLGEQIQPDSAINEFSLELSSFLKELPCPYAALISGPISNRYATVESRLTLLNYLMCELMAAKMCHTLKPEKQVVIEIVS